MYNALCAQIRLDGNHGNIFQVSNGTRQGSVLSPYIFNVFLNDLLLELEKSECGIVVGQSKCNSLAYADDIDLFASSTVDLQTLVTLCYNYSMKWRFKFGVKKTQFYIAGSKHSVIDPVIMLGDKRIPLTDSIEILGKTFSENGKSMDHILDRITKCRKAMNAIGYRNEELCPAVKAHIWESIGIPTLTYALSTSPISPGEMQLLESFQGTMIKSSLYLGKRSHHSNILQCLGIDTIQQLIIHPESEYA